MIIIRHYLNFYSVSYVNYDSQAGLFPRQNTMYSMSYNIIYTHHNVSKWNISYRCKSCLLSFRLASSVNSVEDERNPSQVSLLAYWLCHLPEASGGICLSLDDQSLYRKLERERRNKNRDYRKCNQYSCTRQNIGRFKQPRCLLDSLINCCSIHFCIAHLPVIVGNRQKIYSAQYNIIKNNNNKVYQATLTKA